MCLRLSHGTRQVFALENSDKPGVPQDTTSGKWSEIPFFSQWRPGFDLRPVHEGFGTNEMPRGQVFLRVGI